jgi:hypothetical protein
MTHTIYVNGEPVAQELIGQESERIARDPRWGSIADESERARHLRAAAEQSAIERMLIEQAAAADPRPIDPNAVEREVQRMKGTGNCRSAFDDSQVRPWVERQFRIQRIQQEMVAGASKPSAEEVAAFYSANRQNFQSREFFQAAHIVKHVNGDQSEEQRAP